MKPNNRLKFPDENEEDGDENQLHTTQRWFHKRAYPPDVPPDQVKAYWAQSKRFFSFWVKRILNG